MLGGLFNSGDEQRAIATTPWGDWSGQSNGGAFAGMDTSKSEAMQLLAVFGSVRMISESIAMMPPGTYRKKDATRIATESPKWLEQPTQDLNWVDWCSQVCVALLTDGNLVAEITRDKSNEIRELIPVDAGHYSITTEGRKKVIRIDGKNRAHGTVLHIPGMMLPGSVVGLAPLEYARQTIGLGLAAAEFGAGFFERDGNMPGVIELPRPAEPEVMRKMASNWKRMRTKSGQGLPGIIDDGAMWKPNGVTSEQMQFLQTRQYSAGEVAGQLFGLDPADLGIPVPGSSLSYANLDQRNVRRLQVTFLPHIHRIEKALSPLLRGSQFLKLGTDALLRGDTKSRYEAYKIGLEGGFLLLQEVRELEDRRPLTKKEIDDFLGKSEPPPPMEEPPAEDVAEDE